MSVGYVDPVGDNAVTWTPSAGTDHYALVDDGVRQPDAPDTADYVSYTAAPGANEDFDMGTLTVSEVSSVTVWAYAKHDAAAALNLNVYLAGAWQTANTTNTLSGTYAWYSATWNGSWSQADLDALLVRVTKTNAQEVYVETVAAIYADITYEPVAPPAAGGHFAVMV